MDSGIREMLRPKLDQLNGKQTAERTMEITFLSTVTGAGLSALSLAITPKAIGEAAVRTGTVTGACACIGAIFAMTTSVAASMRDQDTPLNYFIGGCSSGLFIGAATKSFAVGSGSCAALGSAAAFYKFWKKNDWGPFIPDRKY